MKLAIALLCLVQLVTLAAVAMPKRVPISSCEAESIERLGLPFRGTLSGDEEWAEPITADEIAINFDGRVE